MQNAPLSPAKLKNEICVKKSSSIRSLVTRGLHVLTEQEVQNIFTVEAQGLSIGKAVTIIEILKRRLRDAELKFWQYNKLDSAHTDTSAIHMISKDCSFDLKHDNRKDILKNIKTKVVPILRIKLSRLPLELTDGWKEQLDNLD
ncbi:uncharacterized protein T551_00656 [Pneumocystis jirovecii RU7]|uniref:DNA/RNA-binding protein Alba-like domain-containing protein n=1 Tax=Pneumocystis jirovecii (strain RU7) TaxID=1408657 RepID=A0A0W4ZUB4_PNEJ7|nr:uncharacterized protein T551_00656 [Pneumocystis jirovecii RU7]KTW31974.1 hypothetical protein T551_00656 [Pneumocystis jirovecii RU7]